MGISPTQGRYLHRTTQTQNKCRQTSMPLVGFEPTVPPFERVKTFHALDRVTAVIGQYSILTDIVSHSSVQFVGRSLK
jgi:hypothetical protein